MLVDRYPAEDVFARVPELAEQTDPVLKQLDMLLDDDELYARVRADLGQRHRSTKVAWAAFVARGGDPPPLVGQASLSVELSRDPGTGER